jgi:hypothetical protein
MDMISSIRYKLTNYRLHRTAKEAFMYKRKEIRRIVSEVYEFYRFSDRLLQTYYNCLKFETFTRLFVVHVCLSNEMNIRV